MDYITKQLEDALKVYEENFHPEKVLPGVKWRKDAMKIWSANNRPELTPIVTNKVACDDPATCISCGAFIDLSKDDRLESERAYRMNTCHECVAAREMLFSETWERYSR